MKFGSQDANKIKLECVGCGRIADYAVCFWGVGRENWATKSPQTVKAICPNCQKPRACSVCGK